ncbi:ABC transporter permease [Flavisolibacter sp. BT320]|nr:ABC transporter permease [Flavisolibacter longurius]
MLQHHLLIAFRNLQRHRGSFFINLVGLSTGLACAFLIYLWVLDERSFDRFHQKSPQLYQVMEKSSENGAVIVHEGTQGPLAAAMAKDLPEVQTAVPVMSLKKEGIFVQMRNGDKVVRGAGIFAGNAFFTTFSFPLLQGNPGQVLAEKNSIVISAALARSLYGSAANATGKPLQWELFGEKRMVTVSGVFDHLPANTSLQFDFAMPFELMMTELAPNFQKWSNEGPATYLVLKPGTNIEAFNAKIKDFIRPYFKETIFSLFVRPYASGYLYGRYENGQQAGGRIEYVRLFSLVALFIIVIACINFMNLSTARASRRLKEVGIKKVVGSTRKALVFQFLSEAVFITFLSLLLACFLVAALLPFFSQVTGKNLVVDLTPQLVLLLLGVTLLTGLLAGSYPAFYLSGFSPVAVLKGKLKNSVGELFARKGLVVFQFVVSLVLIVAVLVVYQQVAYVQSKHLGYDKANVITFDREGAAVQNSEAFLTELRRQPGIVSASAIQQGIVQGSSMGASTYGIDWPGKTGKDLVDFAVRAVDYDLLETLGVQLKEGRSFSPAFGADDRSIVFNEAAIKAMNLKEPVIGTKVNMWGEEKTIIGVVKDFHFTSLHDAIAPMLFFYGPKNASTIVARIEPGKEQQVITGLQAFYKKVNPGYVFDYSFLDQAYQAQYVAEQRVSLLSRFFAGLAILISCLGLFGLAAFNAEVRTKEIGIRKVLGASVNNIMLMLSKDFVRLVLLAILIAFPLAWWAMNSWLHGFAYHITISPWVFVTAGIAILLISLLTLGFQSVKTALMNPIKSLRSE